MSGLGLRGGLVVDAAGVTAIVGVELELLRQPSRGPPQFGEDTTPVYAPPSGLALRAAAYAGTSLGGALAIMIARGRQTAAWTDGKTYETHERWTYRAIGVELDADDRGVAVRVVEAWDRLHLRRPAM
jgi:hypothetical protein